jgi:dipeptidyl aminopeptidase/acylaminoacyl peptidase
MPTENLVAEGIPPIPGELVAEVGRYTESRSAGFVDWHPTERQMLITTRFGNTAQIHQLKMPGGARTQLTFFAEPVGSASWEPKTGAYFVFGRDAGGNEFSQLYRHDIKDGKITLLTAGGRSQNGGPIWNHAKDKFMYSSTRRNGADRDLWLMDPKEPQSSRLISEFTGGGWTGMDWSPDDSQVIAMEYLSVNRSNLWLIEVATGKRKALNDPDREVAHGEAAFSRLDKGLYYTSDEQGEFKRLYWMDLESGKSVSLTGDIPWDVDGFDLSEDGRWLAFAVNEAGLSKAYLMDTSTGKHRPIEGLPKGLLGGGSWHPTRHEVAFTVSSSRSTSDVYTYDVATNKVERWTESELGGLVADDLSEPQLIRWRSFDGLEISGFLYPAAQKFTGKRPVIIDIHGGPEGQARPGFLGRDNYFLNELGVAIIYPNVRGSTGFGKTFVTLDNALKREDSVRDIGALLDWIGQQPGLDAERVMIQGGSYGGYMSLACSVHYSDRIRCSIDIVGISNFATFLKNTESYRRDLRRVEYGDERVPEVAAHFEKISPLSQADKIKKPLFVVQAGNDPRVPLSEAEQIVAKVKSNGGPVWYLMAKDEGHGFRKKANADFEFYATILFVREFLLK